MRAYGSGEEAPHDHGVGMYLVLTPLGQLAQEKLATATGRSTAMLFLCSLIRSNS